MHIKSISAVLTVNATPYAQDTNDDLTEVVCFTSGILVTVDGLANPLYIPAGSSKLFDARGISIVRSSSTDATAQVVTYREDRL